jgi:ribosomal protein S18 acetylase RimI-like enzyme
VLDGFTLRRVSYDHPDPQALTVEAQRFFIKLYGTPDETPFTSAEFADPNGAFLVGYLAARPVVMGGWRLSSAGVPATAQRPVELKRMFVRADVRGRGLAQTLLAALEADAVASGADWMILQTGAPQVAAVALYRRAGYDDIESFGHYAHEPDVVNLGKRLAGSDVYDHT